MRKLIVARGHQGTGKTTFLREQGLGGHVLSPDTIRRTLAGPVLTAEGRFTTPQEHDARVWGLTMRLLEERMERGELVAIDATHRAKGDFKPYLELAARRRYAVCCLDFSTLPLDLALERNRQRPDYEVVPEEAVRRTWASCQAGQVPEEIHRIFWAEDGSHAAALREWLELPLLDASRYRAVVHVGDLQGCLRPLQRWLADNPLSDDVLYVFVGDFCDRGIENAAVTSFLLGLLDRPNVRLLWGNHEDYLDRWSRGEDARNAEFTQHTAPQLAAAGITPADVDRLCARLEDALWYDWRGQRALVTHAGLPLVPAHPERVSTRQLAHGTGFYSDPVDARFEANAPPGWVQVHGHRNAAGLPVQAAPRSYNLEGGVEHGGHLRLLVLDERGFTPVEIRNTHFRPLKERIVDMPDHRRRHYPPWVGPDLPAAPVFPAEELAALRSHELIQEKVIPSRPWISSFNFTRDAFFNQEWDELNVTARGLFLNTTTGEIVARSYDKFFNLGERPETHPQALRESLRFPVSVYRKDNGYLGILGYDAQGDDLFFASKSTADSDFAGWFAELVSAALQAGKRDELLRYLRDTHSAMAFEVLDPARDPHIIRYDRAGVVLLDVIRRSPAFERMPYDDLRAVGDRFGLPAKGLVTRQASWEGLWGFLQQATQPGWRLGGEWLEGFVIEDAAGFQFKVKLDYYNHWKRMRALKQRIMVTRRSGRPLGRDITEPRVQAFYDWAIQQPDAVLEQDIIVLRDMFAQNVPPPPNVGPVDDPLTPAQAGFQRALENLDRLPAIKTETADKLVAAALADDRKMAMLGVSPARVRLLLAATPGEDRTAAADAVGVDLDKPEASE